ncbi:hypothetical protein [Cutibacterium modestum]|uniref:hypothetical protein n=1 Tax=Cutibacterium modestum TaxID=2559073 RepID=UPI000206FCB5|nr:hypothetical protein [Cutibacterium modestum]EGG27065.1 hypothetical protein PA08_1304 [Cutibacterium modestum P08]REB74872.1 hypothetical protein CP877_03295 [Cutibacterium modestum]
MTKSMARKLTGTLARVNLIILLSMRKRHHHHFLSPEHRMPSLAMLPHQRAPGIKRNVIESPYGQNH